MLGSCDVRGPVSGHNSAFSESSRFKSRDLTRYSSGVVNTRTTPHHTSAITMLRPRDYGINLQRIVWRCLYNGSKKEGTSVYTVCFTHDIISISN